MARRMCEGSKTGAGRSFVPLRACLALVALLLSSLLSAGRAEAQTWTTSQQEQNHPDEAAPGRSHYRVDSTSTFVGYRIRSPLAPVSIEERRFVEWLAVDHRYELGERDEGGHTRWQLVTRGQLRLDQEFGRDCTRVDDACFLGTDSGTPRTYQVLTRRTRLDVPSLSLTLQGPRSTSVGLGRQTVFDGAGFARVDGVLLRSTPHRLVSVQAFGGLQVVGTSVAGSSGFAPQGTLRVSLPSGLAPRDAPFVAPESTVRVVGGYVRVGDPRYVRGEFLFRETRDDSGLVARRIGGALLTRPLRFLSLRGRLLADPALGRVVDALGEVALAAEGASLRARLIHHEPTFDLGSIWAYFNVIPVQQVELVGSKRFGPLNLQAGVRGRRAIGEGTERDVGGNVAADLKIAAWRLSLTGWLWAGDLSPVASVGADIQRMLGDRGRLGLRGSVWHFDDPFRTQVYATSVSTTVYGAYRLTEYARVQGEFEYGYNRVVGSRLRGLVSLGLRMWR